MKEAICLMGVTFYLRIKMAVYIKRNGPKKKKNKKNRKRVEETSSIFSSTTADRIQTDISST